ncbi:His Kinase A (phospho-acceptor) domain-containing protein [Maridesulfovibrio ferrireducens]|uniref:histidine kinase n=1 Tax=Maridesulfovibrio ferrireducens TaxID=246191 RepID=A0A1G9FCB9_9BACT|nr:PAS domain-containing sensor histidine kinase [Maridesulfovibrio ferrireducens]SDK85873.1 His Kinase A (phospho-acceptor) domain-containing protein [Maridesulfovibrio ferrireducens]
MSLKGLLRPEFWNADKKSAGPYKSLFDYQRIWRLCFVILVVVSLVPLFILAFIDFNVTRVAINSENMLRGARTTSNTRRAVAYFLEERKSALQLIVQLDDFRSFQRKERLAEMLRALKNSFGGFIDLGIIDEDGKQLAYVGPYNLEGKDYKGQAWFKQATDQGTYISDVFLGFRDSPHLVIAVKHYTDNEHYKIYRATLDTTQFNGILSSLDLSEGADAFLVNNAGIMQTPSKWNGDVFSKISFSLPEKSFRTKVEEIQIKKDLPAIVGYAYIEGTPFILMVVKPEAELMGAWQGSRDTLTWISTISVAVILLVMWAVASYMVERIYMADMTRSKLLQQMEHHNRMASIGRLAAGVAHEINNPLAIINEKAGLLKDLFTFNKAYEVDARVLGLLDSVIGSVERCGRITKRLLGFSRQDDVELRPVYPKTIVETVLSFLNKEAEYRSINVSVDVESGIYEIVTDRGKLEQVLLNLISNAFQAMKDGGALQVKVARADNNRINFSVKDDGCGIPATDLKRIFEPFYSTKKQTGGTGLGLSITYGLVQDLGGLMVVESELGMGTEFRFSLPVNPIAKGES